MNDWSEYVQLGKTELYMTSFKVPDNPRLYAYGIITTRLRGIEFDTHFEGSGEVGNSYARAYYKNGNKRGEWYP